MNGYKTGGDWTDITSVGRNEIVFEGRHKDYGAFYIRQRYPNALLLSLMSAIGIMVACAVIPYVFKVRIPLPPKLIPGVTAKPTYIPIYQVPPPPHQTVRLPKNTTPQTAPPVITRSQPVDSDPVERPINPTTVASLGSVGTIETPGTNSSTTLRNSPPVPDDNKTVVFASTMPKFPGGKIDDYLAQKLQYPAEEARLGIQGTAYVSFIVERDGSVSSVKLVRGISSGEELNQEALRVLSEMPKWIPGNQDGHPVRVQYVVPIHFKLQ